MTGVDSSASTDEDTARCVELLRRLIATPSLPGQEQAIAELVAAEMKVLGLDPVEIDEAGNVLGTVRGRGEAPPLLFLTHLDHVDVGDPSRWPHPPFAGTVAGGAVWGRGAVDIKGPLAAQLIAAGRLARGEPPAGDVIVASTVQEEIGGLGARRLVRSLPAKLAVVGEPSRNQIRRGHRGRVEIVLHLIGRSVHASVPAEGANPLFSLARALTALEHLDLHEHKELGATTVTPTLLKSDQSSANVVPGELWQILDCRLVPGHREEDLSAQVSELVERALGPGIRADVSQPVERHRSYRDYEVDMPAGMPAYLLEADHRAVSAAADIVERILRRSAGIGVWKFATDGGHLARAGCAPIGFGPGDDLLAHTVDEHVEIEALGDAIRVNEALGRELATSLGG